MACRGPDAPTEEQEDVGRLAKRLLYLSEKLNVTIPAGTAEISNACYPSTGHTDWLTATLCKILKQLPETEIERVVYNARSKKARDLADWWEEHQALDKHRADIEKRLKAKEVIKKKALAKLTKAERKALGFQDE